MGEDSIAEVISKQAKYEKHCQEQAETCHVPQTVTEEINDR